MPERLSLVLLKEAVANFNNKKIIEARGNAKTDLSFLLNKNVNDIKIWGKQILIYENGIIVRIYFQYLALIAKLNKNHAVVFHIHSIVYNADKTWCFDAKRKTCMAFFHTGFAGTADQVMVHPFALAFNTFYRKKPPHFCEGFLCENFHSDTLLSFLRLPEFFFIMRNIISFKLLFFIFPVVQIIPDTRTMPVRTELNVFFANLATLLFHNKRNEKIIPYKN